MLLVTQHINIIAKEQFMVKSFCNNFDWVCPFHWANSLLWVWMVWTPLSNIRAMPENPTEMTTKPKTNPSTMLRITISFKDV
jgi:hypothetical protein